MIVQAACHFGLFVELQLKVQGSVPTMKTHSAILSVGSIVGLASARDDDAVSKVVTLLEEMQARIEADGEDEQKIYDKYACWCETTTSKKAQAITDVREELKTLGTTILQLKGKIATRATEIKELIGDIKDNEEAQETATGIRTKENAAFMAEKSETQQAIAALEKAMTVLSDNSLLQRGAARHVLARAHAAVAKASKRIRLNSKQLSGLKLLDRAHSEAPFLEYAPQSATIQGILSDMYHTFADNLESATHEEASLHRNFEALMAEKHTELVTLQESLTKKEQEKAEAETMLADASQNYADAETQMHADIKFFDVTKDSCELKTEDWSKRKELRSSELEGISKALEILTSDEAKDLFSKSIKPGRGTGTFLQISSSSDAPVAKAIQALNAKAKESHSIRLASIAATLRMESREELRKSGHFDDVMKAIDTLMKTLKEEQADDDKKKDECKEQLHELQSSIDDVSWKLENNEAQIQKVEQVVQAKEAEKAKTLEELTTITTQIGDMESERKEENQAFITAKDDDQKAIDLLKEARDKLGEYYESQGAKSFLQIKKAKDEPEAKFSGKNSRKGESKGIVSLLNMIIEDLEEEIKSGEEAEEGAQTDFEKRMEAAKALQEDLQTKETNLDEQIALENSELEKENDLKTENTNAKMEEEKTFFDVKPDCDLTINKSAERRKKRETEMQGLQTAKNYLAGAMSLSQRKRGFDDDAFSQVSFGSVSFLQTRR